MMLPVTDVRCRYRRRGYDDLLQVECWSERLGRASISLLAAQAAGRWLADDRVDDPRSP